MLRLGIVDFDSSHSIEFTRRFNRVGVTADQFVDGARVVLGWPGDSEMSPERIPGFTRQITECDVELVDDPAQMIGRIDAVLVLSLCGRVHLQRVRPFLDAGVPAYVDKPFACSLADAVEMTRLAATHQALLFGGSALRFAEEIEEFSHRTDTLGALHGAVTYGPAKRADGNPGLFHYGIHPTEMLFALMGPDCGSASTAYEAGGEVVTGRWNDGRLGVIRGIRTGSTAYGFLAFCERGVVHQPVSTRFCYRNLCRAIVRSLESGEPAITTQQMLQVVRFVLASLESENGDGAPVQLDAVVDSST